MNSLQKKIKIADSLDKDAFTKLLDDLSDLYFNGETNVTDEVYDSLVNIYEKKFGNRKKVGAPVGNKYRETLPKYLGSLDKVKTKDELRRWTKKKKGPYIIEDKVDGISALLCNGKLLTRGNGTVGTNVSHILKYISLPTIKGCVRGELYISKTLFNKKYKEDFANARNMVAGLLNPLSKNRNVDAVKDLTFIAYEYDDKTYTHCHSKQLDILSKSGFITPVITKRDSLSIEDLTELISLRKLNADYDMDGLVIVHDFPEIPVTGENPDNAIAFKIEGECIVTEVQFVEWNPSKHGILKPRVKVKPVSLCGVEINWTTGFNAKFIKDNNIAGGAKISITRSGDVIPYIKEVIEPAEEPDMPLEDYRWNETEVDIIIDENDEVKMRKIVEFFKTLDAKFVGTSTIEKIYKNGFNTLQKILSLDVDSLVKIDGIQKKSATRIVDAIQKSITNVSLARIAAASGCLGIGFGEKKIQSIVSEYPNILDIDESREDMIDLIKGIGGFQKTAGQFVDNLPKLKEFLKTHPTIKLEDPKEVEIVFEDSDDEYESLSGKTIVFTGIRDKKLENNITLRGGKVTTSVSKKTSILVTSQRYSGSTKEHKAEQLDVEILTIDEFKEKYGL